MKTISLKNQKKILILVFSVFVPTFFIAQNTAKDIFSKDEIVWYGLDFSEAKFIGKFTQALDINPVTEFDLVNTYIPAWNALVVAEPENFNLRSTFWKKRVYYDLRPVTSRNNDIKTDDLITFNSHEIPKSKLSEMISAYKTGDKEEGIGLVFIVESFDKNRLEGNFWVVFFDIKTKTILLNSHCTGTPVGFGLRNYWAGSIKHVLRDIHHYKFNSWRRALKEGSEFPLN